MTAARDLVLSHLRLVVSVARNYMGYGLPQADLVQEGNIGLMKAVKRFDPERGVRLASFAIHWIKAEIHEYILRNWRLVKVATTKAQRKLFFNLRSMKKSTRRAHADRGQADREDAEREGKRRGRDGAAPPGPGHRRSSPRPTTATRSLTPIAYLREPGEGPAEQLRARRSPRALQSDGPRRARSRASTSAAAASSGALARRIATRRRCTSSPTNSASPPSASARSRRRRCRR